MQYYELRIKIPVPDELIEIGDKDFIKKYLNLCCTESVNKAVKDLRYSPAAEKGKLTRRELLLDYLKRAISAMSDRDLYDIYDYNFDNNKPPFNLCEWCQKKAKTSECPEHKKCPISEFLQEEI